MCESCLELNSYRSMFPQLKVEAYMGKHGATVPSVRMITLFCPARQFHSSKAKLPSLPCTIPAAFLSISEVCSSDPLPSPYQPSSRMLRPEDILTKVFVSSSP